MLNNKKFLLFLALIIGILPVLGLAKISGSSEAREAHVASVILQSSEWILPDRNGFVPSKPILHHWLISACSFVSGQVSEFSARLPSALLGIISILITVLFLDKLLTNSESKNNHLVFLSALVLVSTYGFFRMLFSSMVDLTFAFFCLSAILLIIYPLILASKNNQEVQCLSNKHWCCFFILCGLATLAKGPLGLVLPSLFLLAFYSSLFGFKNAILDCIRPKLAWFLWASLALPWYILAYFKAQSAFIERQIIFENLERFLGGQNVNSEPFWFYLPSFLTRMAPWSIILSVLIATFFYMAKKLPVLKLNSEYKVIRAFCVALFAVIVFFSLSSGKRHSYLLPLFPIFSILLVLIVDYLRTVKLADSLNYKITKLIFIFRSSSLEDKLFNFARSFTLLILVLVCAALVYLKLANSDSLTLQIASDFIFNNITALAFAPVLAALSLCASLYLKKDKQTYFITTIFLFSSVFSSILVCVYGIKAEFRDYPKMARDILVRAGDRKIMAVRDKFDELLDPIFFYLRKPVQVIAQSEEQQICQDKDAVYLIRSELFDNTAGAYKQELQLRELVGKPGSIESRAITLFSCADSISKY